MSAGPPAAPPRRTSRHSRPPLDASMTLLTEVMHRPLDPGYAEAAARRARGDDTTRRTGTRVRLAVLAVGLGLVTTVAALDLRAPQPAAVAARSMLEQEITDRRTEVDALTAQTATLEGEIDQLQTAALSGASPELLETLRTDAIANGAVAVAGPGVIITLRDAAGGLVDDSDPSTKVQDVDLQRVVNALWASGAEAVAVNDQRLTTLSAIRSAGSAILVDLQPLIGPYRVVAIGDPETLQTQFARSGTADYLRTLSSSYGIQSNVAAQSRLEAPAGGTGQLFYARPVDSGDEDQDDDGSQGAQGLAPGPHQPGDDVTSDVPIDLTWDDLLGSPGSRSGWENEE